MKRKLLSFILTLAMVLSLVPAFSVAAFAGTTPDYLTFTAEEADSTVTFKWQSGSVWYSTGAATEFQTYAKGTCITLASVGDKVMFKGYNVKTDSSNHFSMTGKIAASGDVGTLTDETGGASVNLVDSTYFSMFLNCTSLTQAPKLLATLLVSSCYQSMFEGCTSLVSAPALPATNLQSSCYQTMFKGCVNLIEFPNLTASTLAPCCYCNMFEGCSKIVVKQGTSADFTWEIPYSGTTAPVDDMLKDTADNNEVVKVPTSSGSTNYYKVSAAQASIINSKVYNYASVQDAINAASAAAIADAKTVTIEADIDLDETIVIPAGKAVTIDLNGHVLNAGKLTAPGYYQIKASVIYNEGILNLIDSNPTAAHYFEYASRAAWTLTSGAFESVTLTPGGITSETEDGTVVKVEGGIITGGKGSNYNASSANKGGGIVSTTNGSKINISGCAIVGNKTEHGGGIYVNNSSTLIMTGTEILGNMGKYYGAGVNVREADFFAERCMIANNYSEQYAGGVGIFGKDGKNLSIKNCVVTRNVAKDGGAGVLFQANEDPEISPVNLILSGETIISENCLSTGETSNFSLNNALKGTSYSDYITICSSVEISNLSPDSKIGISTAFAPTVANAVAFTEHIATSTDLKGCFFSDKGYAVIASGNALAIGIEPKYLTFTAEEENSTVTFSWKSGSDVMYSTGGAADFQACTSGTCITLANVGDQVMFKGTGVNTNASNHFSMTGKVAASGSATSLIDGIGCDRNVALPDTCFSNMFDGCTSLTSAPAVPATTLAPGCYTFMFNGCTSLTSAPELPATTLKYNCYFQMFNGCTSLISAPSILPATLLESDCYNGMFGGCTSLISAPQLPATILANNCYKVMFKGCTSLTSAPALSATTLANYCYMSMFDGCTSLISAPAILPAETLTQFCYYEMFIGCTSLTSAPVLSATTLAPSCCLGMFKGCSSLTSAPALPATTLADYCYYNMFYNCTSLITAAAVLPATVLASNCYNSMFYGCSNLISVPELKATTLADRCYNNMFYNCSKLAVKKADASTANVIIPATSSSGAMIASSMFWNCKRDGVEITPAVSSTAATYFLVSKAELTYTVTFDAAGGSTVEPQTVKEGECAEPPIPDPTRSGYTFGGWLKDGAPYNFSTPVTANITLVALWNEAPGPTPPPTPSYDDDPEPTISVPVSGDSGSVNVSATVYGETAEVNNLTQKQIEQVGTEGKVVMDLSGLSKLVTGINIPKLTVENVSKSDAKGLEVVLANGMSAEFNKEALASIAKQAQSSIVRLVVEEGSKAEGSMNSAQKAAIKDMKNPVVIDASLQSNGETISNFEGGQAVIKVPYASAKPFRASYIDKAGASTEVSATRNGKFVYITVNHFSHYVVEELEAGYASCAKDGSCVLAEYTDTKAGEWYHDGVHFCIDNGIMGGYGNGKFGPSDTLSRAMVMQMLYKMESSPKVAEKSSFTDVPADQWYADAVAWAEDNGIAGGYGNGKFGPEDPITREQFAKILYAYAKLKGYDISASEDLSEFTDAAKTSTWAVNELKWAKAVKLVSGKGNGIIDPTGKASRAEAATMIKNFCENVAK